MIKKVKRFNVEEYAKLFTSPGLMDVKSAKVAYIVDKNLAGLAKEENKINKFIDKCRSERGIVDEKYVAAEKALLEQYCAKNEKGVPIVKDGHYTIDDKQMFAFNVEKEKLKENNV
jgi:hypothetical protein